MFLGAPRLYTEARIVGSLGPEAILPHLDMLLPRKEHRIESYWRARPVPSDHHRFSEVSVSPTLARKQAFGFPPNTSTECSKNIN